MRNPSPSYTPPAAEEEVEVVPAEWMKGIFSTRQLWCLVCGLVMSSQLEFGDVAKSQMTFGQDHQTPTYYGYYDILHVVSITD